MIKRIKRIREEIKAYRDWKKLIKSKADEVNKTSRTTLISYNMDPAGKDFFEVFGRSPRDVAKKLRLIWDKATPGTTSAQLLSQTDLFDGTDIMAFASVGMGALLDYQEHEEHMQSVKEALQNIIDEYED